MTDLERHWEELPVGPAPVDDILREARGAAAHTPPRSSRALRRVGVVGTVAAAFVAGTFVAQHDFGGSGGSAPPPTPGAEGGGLAPVAFHGELQQTESCATLLEHYVERGVDLVTRYGWGAPTPYPQPTALRDLAGTLDTRANAPLMEQGYRTSAKTTGARASETGTNVQEAGVDEPDGVKTDGALLVRLRGAELTTYDVTGDEVTELGTLDLGDFHDGELLLAEDTVVALGNDGTRPDRSFYGSEEVPQTRVLTIDVEEPSRPALVHTVDYDAALLAARQHGAVVRLTLSKGLPDLDFAKGRRAARTNRELVEATTINDWLPHVSVDDGEPERFPSCSRVAVPRAEIGLGTTAVVGFTAEEPGELDSLAVAGDAPLTYESTDHLYLASTPASESWFCRGFCDTFAVDGGTTHLYAFSLDGTGASYLGAGEVEGTIRDRWSMDEAGGVLRLAVGPSSETGSFNSVVTMRPAGDELVEVGRLDRLGVGEDIKSVRWSDGLALVVTFRQVDPLYAVDLTRPRVPRLLGELKIPGFSSYLHPLGPMRVVGLGEGPQPGRGWGAQAGLFDVTDLSSPRRLDVHSYGSGTQARAGEDPRQLTWLPDRRTVLTVLSRGRSGFVSTLAIDRGRLSNDMTRVEYGDDVREVRLVPLPDGKVVLVTGEDVTFFPLP